MRNTSKIIILALIILLLASCSNEVKAPDDSWEGVFLQFWNQMNNEYVHFSEEDSINWDDVYDEYIDKFKALDFTKKEDSIKAFRYFKEIVYGVHDYHYSLVVKDKFGQVLETCPADLQKYAAAGGDIMDYPDVTLVDDNGGEYLTAINNPKRHYSDEEKAEIRETAIPSWNEVKDLMGDATGTGSDWGNFHTTTGNTTATEFTNGYYGYTFSSLSSDDFENLTVDDEKTIDNWNDVIKAMELTSYFYGVNKDYVFYIYFSDFGDYYFLTNIFTTDKLSEGQQAFLAKNKEYAKIRVKTRDLIEKVRKGSISNTKLKEAIEEGVKGIYGLQAMYYNLLYVTSESKCVFTDGTVADIKGVVMDLRGNTGGYVDFLKGIWGAFFPTETQFGYERYKSGYARNEYTPWVSYSIDEAFVSPYLNEVYQKPVAVLVNGRSVSCSEISCIISKLLPNSIVIGQQTYGATCCLRNREIYNGGPFDSDHIEVYTTTYQFVDNNRVSYETVGITPDIKTELSTTTDNAFSEGLKFVTK